MAILELRNVAKRFGAIEALRGVELTIEPGEAIGLVGDNGAGKSTLFKIIAGVYTPDEGELLLEGCPRLFTSPIDARDAGIEIVYQDLALCDNLDAALNIFLGREITRSLGPLRFIDSRAMRRRARELVERLEVEVNFGEPVRAMSGGQRQAIAIARALLGSAKLVLLDEPTAAISISAVEQVLRLVRQLKERGHTVVIISHRMSDIFETCDRIVVMRHGQNVATKRVADTDPKEVTGLMTGAIARA
jgi:simple sugar transport system ATP-binding protein